MLSVTFASREIVFTSADATYTVPVGVDTLATMISGDPPQPEDLVNAIGLVTVSYTHLTLPTIYSV